MELFRGEGWRDAASQSAQTSDDVACPRSYTNGLNQIRLTQAAHLAEA